MSSEAIAAGEKKIAEDLGEQIGRDLSMIIDRDIAIESVEFERVTDRVAGEDLIHISFRLEFMVDGELHQGCLLMPLPAAISVAGYLMVLPDEEVTEHRALDTLDRATKDAMLEVGNFIGGSADSVLSSVEDNVKIVSRFVGCQGVAPGAIPNFKYTAGGELVLARISAVLGKFDPFEMILMLPSAVTA